MKNHLKKYFYGEMVFIVLWLLFCCMLFTSCDNSHDADGKHPFFIKAENLYNDGKYNEAIPFYQKYLDINSKSSKANYRLANIFQQEKDYIKAVFYYEKYLALNPNSSDKEIVEKWIHASKESLAKQLSKQYSDNSGIVNENETEMAKENKRLQNLASKQNNTLQETEFTTHEVNVLNKKQPLPVVKYYTIKEGDNFQRISRKFYGSSKYYKVIIDANKDILKGTTVLKIGEKIIIPSLIETNTKKEN